MDATPTKYPPVSDLALALAFLVLAQAEIWVFTAGDGYPTAVRLGAAALTAIASGALAYRRERPALAFWVNGAAVIATILVGYPSDIYQWTNLVAIYSLGAYATTFQAWAGLPMGVAGVVIYFARFPNEGSLAIAAFAAAMWVVGWLAGRMYGARIEEARLRTERDLSRHLAEANEARLALEEERNRMARELHDIIGHTVNVMVVHAEAGRREIDRNVDMAAQAFDTIAQTGRDALSELDRVLAVLRRDDAELALASTPGINDLDRLAASFTDTGLDVDVSITGEVDQVPVSVGLATYRVAQEALTNSLKHSSASRAEVSVDVGPDQISVVIIDNGQGASIAGIQNGRGLIGMRERVSMHQGTLQFGQAATGGFAITALMRWDGQ